jgi:hypothetical protein
MLSPGLYIAVWVVCLRKLAAGGDGPHSGGGKEHGRANWIARGSAPTDGLAGLTPIAPNGAGSLRTAPIDVSGTELRLRIATRTNAQHALEAAASIKVHVESLDGTRILTGVVRPFASENTGGGGSQDIAVIWNDKVASSKLLAAHGQTVVLHMELSGGATLFSYAFE